MDFPKVSARGFGPNSTSTHGPANSTSFDGHGPPQDVPASTFLQLYLMVAFFQLISVVAVCLRFLCRRISKNKLGAEDWLILVAMCLGFGHSGIDVAFVHYGGQSSSLGANLDNFRTSWKVAFAGEIIYAPVIVAIKLSVLSLYLRLFRPKMTARIAIYVLIVLSCAWGVCTVVPIVFQCVPMSAAYDKTIEAQCLDIQALFVGTNTVDVLLDIGILIIPVPTIWRLQAPLSKKIAIIIIFLLGIFDTLVAALRLASLSFYDSDTSFASFHNPMIWSTIEVNIGIVCACLPLMAPLFGKVFGTRLTGRRSDEDPQPLVNENHHDPAGSSMEKQRSVSIHVLSVSETSQLG